MSFWWYISVAVYSSDGLESLVPKSRLHREYEEIVVLLPKILSKWVDMFMETPFAARLFINYTVVGIINNFLCIIHLLHENLYSHPETTKNENQKNRQLDENFCTSDPLNVKTPTAVEDVKHFPFNFQKL